MEGEAVNHVIARLEEGLGRRWTTDDADRVFCWMDEQVLTILGPRAVHLFRSHFLDMISDEDEPEYRDIVFRGICHDLESLRRNNEIQIDIDDIDEFADDIFEEAFESYFNPVREESDPMIQDEEYEAFDFGETADDVGGATGLSEEGILKNLKEVIIRVSEEDRICVVCQDGFCKEEQSAVAIQGCGHVYHLDCVSRWLQIRDFCPLCKTKVGQEEEDVRSSSSSVVDKFM